MQKITREYRFVSWEDFAAAAKDAAQKFRSSQDSDVDSVVAILPNGIVPALIIAREIGVDGNNIDIVDLRPAFDRVTEDLATEVYRGFDNFMMHTEGRTVLIVDAGTDSGRTMRAAKTLLPFARTISVYTRNLNTEVVGHYGEVTSDDVFLIFPWEK